MKKLISLLLYAKETRNFEIFRRKDLINSLLELTKKEILDLINKINDWVFSIFAIKIREDLVELRFS